VPLPLAWQSAIKAGNPPLPAADRVIPFATGADPSAFFAELYSSSWSGVVSVAVPSGAITRIKSFTDPNNEQAYGGGFDGRWLVWVESLSLVDSNNWQIWAWDTSTNRSSQIGAAATINGQPVLGPIVEPVVHEGRAAWVQANQDGIGEVHLYALSTAHDQVIASHDTTPVLFWGANLMWQHLDVAGRSGHLEMMDPASGRSVVVPEPLASVHGLSFIAVSEGLVAWTDGPSIWAYRPGQTKASLVYQVPHDHASFLGIAGDLITWDGSSGPSALDLRSSSVSTLTPQYGGRFAQGQSLVIYWPVGARGSSTVALSAVDASKLPALPRCQA
jgi:hypothetical protein